MSSEQKSIEIYNNNAYYTTHNIAYKLTIANSDNSHTECHSLILARNFVGVDKNIAFCTSSGSILSCARKPMCAFTFNK